MLQEIYWPPQKILRKSPEHCLGQIVYYLHLNLREEVKQARKSSEDAQATGYTRLEKVQAGQIWGRKSLGPTY